MAVPTLPLTTTVVPNFSISEGLPSGPTISRIESPASNMLSSMVVLPMAWTTMVTVPASGLASAMVSGMRSPASSSRMMTNWPGFCFLAMRGALISNSLMPRAKGRAATIGNTGYPPLLILRRLSTGVCGIRHKEDGHSAQPKAGSADYRQNVVLSRLERNFLETDWVTNLQDESPDDYQQHPVRDKIGPARTRMMPNSPTLPLLPSAPGRSLLPDGRRGIAARRLFLALILVCAPALTVCAQDVSTNPAPSAGPNQTLPEIGRAHV